MHWHMYKNLFKVYPILPIFPRELPFLVTDCIIINGYYYNLIKNERGINLIKWNNVTFFSDLPRNYQKFL